MKVGDIIMLPNQSGNLCKVVEVLNQETGKYVVLKNNDNYQRFFRRNDVKIINILSPRFENHEVIPRVEVAATTVENNEVEDIIIEGENRDDSSGSNGGEPTVTE